MTHKRIKAEIYVICANDGWAKVGFSANSRTRLGQLQSSNPCKLTVFATITVTDARAVERCAHWLLGKAERRGEWFKVSGIAALIAVTRAVKAVKMHTKTGRGATDEGQSHFADWRLSDFIGLGRLGSRRAHNLIYGICRPLV